MHRGHLCLALPSSSCVVANFCPFYFFWGGDRVKKEKKIGELGFYMQDHILVYRFEMQQVKPGACHHLQSTTNSISSKFIIS